MKKRAVALCMAGALALGTCTVSAANGTRNISATFRNIKIVVDGKTLSTSAEPFIYNGTTYLPIRAVGEAVGKEVTWDGNTNTVYLGAVPAGAIQTPATPAPAATGSFPILNKYADMLGFEKEAVLGDAFMTLDFYAYLMYYCVERGDLSGDAKAAYAEAQSAFARVASDPYYADIKEKFEYIYEDEILPYLR